MPVLERLPMPGSTCGSRAGWSTWRDELRGSAEVAQSAAKCPLVGARPDSIEVPPWPVADELVVGLALAANYEHHLAAKAPGVALHQIAAYVERVAGLKVRRCEEHTRREAAVGVYV